MSLLLVALIAALCVSCVGVLVLVNLVVDFKRHKLWKA